MPVDGGGYVLDTDANQFSMGCVLQQMQNGLLKVIRYASKTFSDAELKYCTTRRELAAIIYGLKHYRHFLLGFPFVLRTDHAALTHLLRTPNFVAQSARYLDTLAEYQFTPQYRPGLSHKNADALSRRPCSRDPDQPLCKQCGPFREPVSHGPADEEELPGAELSTTCATSPLSGHSSEDLSEERLEAGPVLQNTGPKLPNVGPVQSTGPAHGAGPEPENAGPVLQNAGPELSTCIELGAGVSVESVQHGTSLQDSQSARPVYVNNVQLYDGDKLTETAMKQPVTTTDSQTGLTLVTNEVLSEQQTRDRIITVVRSWLENPDTVPDDNELHTLSPGIQHLWSQRQTLEVKGGVLYRRYVHPDSSLRYLQVVVPRSLRTEFLDAVHNRPINGHLGVEKTHLKLQEIAYWQGWSQDAQTYVKRCHVCGSYRHGLRRKQGQLQRALANDVMQKVHVDLVGPFCLSKRGFRYLLTAICGFTKYLICVPIRSKHSVTVADALMRHVYLVYNPLEILVHDQGGEFWSDVMKRLATLLEIQPTKITSHRPNSNGVVERVHATLHNMFAKMVERQ